LQLNNSLIQSARIAARLLPVYIGLA